MFHDLLRLDPSTQAGVRARLIDSMHRYGDAARTQSGLLEVHTLRAREQSAPLLIGLAIWESFEAKEAAAEVLSAAIKEDDFDEWETEPVPVVPAR